MTATLGRSPSSLQRIAARASIVPRRPLAGSHVRDDRPARPADRRRRPDLRRAGPAQPALERGEVQRRRRRPSTWSLEAADDEVLVRILDDGPGFPTRRGRPPVRAFYPFRRDRRGTRPARGSACSSGPPDDRDGRPRSGPGRRPAGARSSGSRCESCPTTDALPRGHGAGRSPTTSAASGSTASKTTANATIAPMTTKKSTTRRRSRA